MSRWKLCEVDATTAVGVIIEPLQYSEYRHSTILYVLPSSIMLFSFDQYTQSKRYLS